MRGGNVDPWQGLRGNLLLRSLSPRDALALAPHLHRVDLTAGTVLATGGGPDTFIYFPETLIACLGGRAREHGSFHLGIIGHEGMIGWDALLGHAGGTPPARVQLAGTALAIGTDRIRALCHGRTSLSDAILRFGLVFACQVSETLVSTLHDTTERRLSRWLLMFHDRLGGDEIAITHDVLAALMNVRRASVTDALHVLEGDRMLRCSRGLIVIRDRAALEAAAAQSYGIAEDSYRTAIGPYGKST